MHKNVYSLYVLLIFGLFSFSEGKPCPEISRPHKTRCDVFYKCTELSAIKHVWVPTQCNEGLVYEHSLAVCVLPADDWECSLDNHKSNVNLNSNTNYREKDPISNRDADIYIISNAKDEDITLNRKYDDANIEIIIGTGISDEDGNEVADESVYESSGDGAELVELDGFMPAQNREEENNEIAALTKAEHLDTKSNLKKEELNNIMQKMKTKTETGQPSTNIDPKLTVHLQRLSQLIDGLKHTYQTTESKHQANQTLRPDQLNAFLAHFNIKNKFDSLDPEDNSIAGKTKANKTSHYKQELSAKLGPETKVMLSNTSPHYYSDRNNKNPHLGYSNSQIVVNRPEGPVHFRLPDHNYIEHTDNTPKISEETLKTVLELSKQMIDQQNVPKIIPSSTYFAPYIMQPTLFTPHVDSPFSTNYGSQGSSVLGFSSYYGNQNQNHNIKKPRPQYFDNKGNDYRDQKPSTTIIDNNAIPLQVSNINSVEKEVLDSYGQSIGPNTNSDYNSNPNVLTSYSSNFPNTEYTTVSTTKRPYVSVSATSSSYAITPKPFEYQPSANTIDQYFTPSPHLGNHNVNNAFPSVDNYGSNPTSINRKKPNSQNYKPFLEMTDNPNMYDAQDQLFPQINSNNVEVQPNSQNYGSFENNNEDLASIYNNNDDEAPLITYTFGNKEKPVPENTLSNYDASSSQSNINSVFSTNNQYIARPYSGNYYTTEKNKYASISSSISSGYGQGTQLVNFGGNFMSFDAFQNSILPLLGNNPSVLSTSLNNVEVITCAVGVRQPNITDCTRYYVCSRKDGRVLQYSCPPYTAFSSETRICDAKTYALCRNEPLAFSYSISENKRIQLEALKAIQEVKRRQQQQQAIKAQNMINYLQQYGSSSSSAIETPFSSLTANRLENSELNMLNSYMQQAAAMSQSVATTTRPQFTTPTVKRRKYYCKEGDKIADQTSIYNYFVCYKNAKGQMKGHKMTCTKGLLFCPKSTLCTLPSKCAELNLEKF